jgi:hypothetical protein
LKKRGFGHRLRLPLLPHAKSSRPLDFEVIDDGDTHAGRVVIGHALLQSRLGAVPILILEGSAGKKPINYSFDSPLDFIRRWRAGTLCQERAVLQTKHESDR